MKIRAIYFVWKTQRDVIEEELKLLLDIEDLDNQDPWYFQQRNATAKLALEKMNLEDKAQMERELEIWQEQGNPEVVQQ